MLSQDQLRAVSHMNGPAMVLAGPGSGKTMVITNRIKNLIERGIRPEEILVITFTRAAAQEMGERFMTLCSPQNYRVSFGTFHAVFFQILRNAYGYSGESILREDERIRIVLDIARELKLEAADPREWAVDMLSEISRVKSEQIPVEYYYAVSAPEEEFRKIFRMYRERQEHLRKIDFDDMCVYTADLFHSRRDILRSWQDRFRYILIDEFQDINLLQYKIIRQLALPENNLFIVGDDDQSIYRFRGSRPEIMLGFPEDYPGACVIELRENYRSTSSIVNASLAVISENRKRYRKELHSANDISAPIEVMECADMETQLLYLVKSIRKSLSEGIGLSEIAVLMRTNLQGRAPARKLAEFQIPCRVKETVPLLWDHWIAQDLISYMTLAEADEMERGHFLRVCNRPNRYILRDSAYAKTISFSGLRAYYKDRPWMEENLSGFESGLNMIRNMKPYAAINYIRKGLQYDSFLEEYAAKRQMEPGELLSLADEIQDSSRQCRDKKEWLDKIERMKTMEKELRKAGQDGKDCVTIATLHGSKGLEFTEVFLIDVNEGFIPYRKASLEAEIEEERRLFYVGMTRAKRKLHLFYVRQRYNRKMEPSRFLNALSRGG